MISTVLMQRAQQHLNGEIDRFSEEFRFKTKRGDWLWVLGRGVVVERDDAGLPTRFVGTHTDITERKQAEAALAASERQFRELFEDNPACTFIFDRDGGIQNWNRACDRAIWVDCCTGRWHKYVRFVGAGEECHSDTKNIAAVFEGNSYRRFGIRRFSG